MKPSIPLWLFFLCALLWAILTVVFGWAVQSALSGSDQSGWLGKAAVKVASFPTLTNNVFLELSAYATGDYKDESIRIKREKNADYSFFKPMPATSKIEVPGLYMWANPEKMSDGWRVLIGAFQINGNIENAALLISPNLNIVRAWILDEIPVGGREPRPKYRKFVHGVEVLRDGSVIFTFDGSISLQKFNACGEREWATPGKYHHAVTLDDTGDTVWTFSGDSTLAQVAVADGSVVRQISMDAVIAANPMIDILEIRRNHSEDIGVNSRNTTGHWLDDRFHFNDVDPLPAAIAHQFDSFNAGDLLISTRSLNLIFVLDPETLEIKWWRVGAVQRQHDPDWLASGEIMVLNNRMSRDFSEVTTIDPGTFEKTVMLDGRKYEFYTRIRGKHQLLDDETLVVTSPQQGRAFEINRDGEVVFEVVNVKPGTDDTNYVISELKWLPLDYFNTDMLTCQAQN